jgi:hypothetical protein
MLTGMLSRIYRKSLGNQLAIAIGSGCSDLCCSIPSLASKIEKEIGVCVKVKHPLEYFHRWNELVKKAESHSSRETVIKIIENSVKNSKPTVFHSDLAKIPISNFIDTTFDRSMLKALLAAGRQPILHDWHQMMMGSWKQSNPDHPNIFFCLPPIDGPPTIYGVYEPISANSQNTIQIENMREMLAEKDLLIIGISSFEADRILHLYALCLSYEKAFVDKTNDNDQAYWASRGVMTEKIGEEAIIKRLIPSSGKTYSFLDAIYPGRKMVEITRDKQYDAFISYFSGDKAFVQKLVRDLSLREIHIWLDDREIEIGDSMTDKIQKGLSDSYTFLIVLSPEALTRPWVNEELRAAYAKRLAGHFKILPILHRECEIPPFLVDYKYGDFRDEKRYHEQLALVDRAIKSAVLSARSKK